MARSNTGSTSNRFTTATASVTAAPLTIACFFNPANLTSAQNLLFLSNSGFTSYFGLTFDGANANAQGDNVVLANAANAGEAFGVSPTGGTANAWNHAAAVFTSATSRTAYLNGAGGSANTTSKTPATLTVTHIGSLSTFSPLNGSMAEVGIWNVALAANEILQLSKGCSPLLVRPNNLIRYWPLMGVGTETCRISGETLTVVGSMAKAAHAPIFEPRLPILGMATTSGSQSITGALFTDSDTFFGATVAPGSVGVTGALFTDADTFFGATVSTTASIAGSLFADGDTFFASTVAPGAVGISGALFSNANSFFGSTVSASYSITGALYTDADTFLAATVSASYTVSGGLFSDGDTFFGATVAPGSVSISGALYTDADSFFGATVSNTSGDQAVTGALFTSVNAFNAATISTSYSISGALFTDTDTFYGATASASYSISGALYSDADTFFGASVAPGAVSITGGLYSDADSFFGATVTQASNQTITGALYANDNNFFACTVSGRSDRGGDGGTSPVRNRRKYRFITRDQLQTLLQTEEEAPVITPKRVAAIRKEIVKSIEAKGSLGPAKAPVAEFVQRELKQALEPEMNMTAIREAVENVMSKAAEEAERIEAEIEEEDEFILLMVA